MKALHAIFVGYPNWQREWSWHHPVASLAIFAAVLGGAWIFNRLPNR